LSATFQIDGPVGAPAIHLKARGDSLAFGGASAGALDLSGDAGLRPDDPTRLDVKARNAVLAGVPLERVVLSASGTTARHVLGASAFTSRESLFVEIGGGLDRSRWTGSLDRLDLKSFHAGSWALEHPVPIAASAESVEVRPLSLRSGGSSLRGEGAWSAHHGWSVDAALVEAPLALLDPFLPGGVRIEGRLDGRLEGRSAGPRGPVQGVVELTESPTLVLLPAPRGKADTLALDGGKLNARLDGGGLKAEMELATPGKSRVVARVELPGFDPLAAERASQPLAGRISASGKLDGLDAFVTGIREPRGSFTADLDLKGTLGRPEFAGEAHVKDAAVTLAALGVTFNEIQVNATPLAGGKLAIKGGARVDATPLEAGKLAIPGSARQLRGQLTLDGSFDPGARGGAAVRLEVKGQDVPLMNTRDMQVRVSPDLALEWTKGKAALSGRVDVPFARIQLAGLAPTAQARSPDVVFVGADAESSQAGLRISSRVRLGIKDDVEVRGVGYRVKPEGNLLLIDEPDEVTRASGELKINEGTYKAYGQDLTIERGRLVFGGGPVSNPGVDVRASRTADDGTVAGILISGTALLPVLQLFSVPSMSDANVLSYIMSGKPLDETSGLGKGATSALGVQGGDALARSLAGQVGLGDGSVESSVESSGGMQEASLFLGTYLSPRLYMAYGIGLFEDVRTVRMRYSVASRWSLQAESGKAQSGIIQYRGER
jgi:translocation and assembly module TamB